MSQHLNNKTMKETLIRTCGWEVAGIAMDCGEFFAARSSIANGRLEIFVLRIAVDVTNVAGELSRYTLREVERFNGYKTRAAAKAAATRRNRAMWEAKTRDEFKGTLLAW